MTGRETIVAGLVDPRRRLRRVAAELERRRIVVRAVVPEAHILRRLIAEGALDVVVIGGSGRNIPGELALLREYDAKLPVVVCGDSPARDELLDALRAGASSYMVAPHMGTTLGDELAQAVRATSAGGSWVSPGVVGHLIREVRESAAGQSFAPLAARPDVTRRERQVLELIATGLTYRDIGERLCISGSTVKTHAHSALRKLGLRNRVDVVRWISEESRQVQAA